ncbi:hypothetical protein OHV52_11165 [Acinetobacter baumannii]|nr:hypothetical protein [Acinetobacter baumannii]MDC4526427.1 hypothetical protein [Acinetobacter baumannii]MDH2467404.1 hypothetical protein [Acinetobacter baumannii]MDV7589477.1 hypothetical protein [Acinetobacter baumannii]OTS66079.1 hypothetical protein CAS98_05565 [Acinetobacter baumannii]TPS64773.1 hypothetical protein FJU46_16530 [Acinetobacter baumannii]
MRISEILQARENRNIRGYKHVDNFIKMTSPCTDVAKKLLEKEYNYEEDFLLERSLIITVVSSVEVFYKDYFNLILHVCRKEFVQKSLKEIHQNKYDIIDLIQIFNHEINPYELVSSTLSFQNIETIDKTFSKFLNKKGLWSSLNGMQIRFKETPDRIATFDLEYVKSLQRIFQLRHELVHDPAKTNFFNEGLNKDIDNIFFCILFSHIILTNVINENLETDISKINKFLI